MQGVKITRERGGEEDARGEDYKRKGWGRGCKG